MMIIEVSENKIEKMSACVEEMLSKGGKLMHILEELSSENYDTKNYGDYDEDDYEEDRKKHSRKRKADYYRYY